MRLDGVAQTRKQLDQANFAMHTAGALSEKAKYLASVGNFKGANICLAEKVRLQQRAELIITELPITFTE